MTYVTEDLSHTLSLPSTVSFTLFLDHPPTEEKKWPRDVRQREEIRQWTTLKNSHKLSTDNNV